MRPGLDAAIRALALDGEPTDDLSEFRLAALAFKLIVVGERPIAVAHAVDAAGEVHWLAIRSADRGAHAAYLQLFDDLLRRGLRAPRPVVVDAAGCRWLARCLDRALGPAVVHAGTPRVARWVAS